MATRNIPADYSEQFIPPTSSLCFEIRHPFRMACKGRWRVVLDEIAPTLPRFPTPICLRVRRDSSQIQGNGIESHIAVDRQITKVGIEMRVAGMEERSAY